MFSLCLLDCGSFVYVNESFWVELMIPSESSIIGKVFLTQFLRLKKHSKVVKKSRCRKNKTL
jgi:hypothetical protein